MYRWAHGIGGYYVIITHLQSIFWLDSASHSYSTLAARRVYHKAHIPSRLIWVVKTLPNTPQRTLTFSYSIKNVNFAFLVGFFFLLSTLPLLFNSLLTLGTEGLMHALAQPPRFFASTFSTWESTARLAPSTEKLLASFHTLDSEIYWNCLATLCSRTRLNRASCLYLLRIGEFYTKKEDRGSRQRELESRNNSETLRKLASNNTNCNCP